MTQVFAVSGFLVGATAGWTVGGRSEPAVSRAAATPHRPARTAVVAAAPSRVASHTSRVVRLAFVGDTMLGSRDHGLPPNDAADVLGPVTDLLRADVTVGNLEGTLTDLPGSKCPPPPSGTTTAPAPKVTCYAFRSPPEYARVLARAGFTVMSLANNHANDAGGQGYADTKGALVAAGITPTGEPGGWATRRVHGVRVAVVAFAPYPWANSLTDIPGAMRLVREAAGQADIVVVTMHAGAEGTTASRTPNGSELYLGENRGDVRAFAHAVVEAGADAVVGHGPHVLRGMEIYRGKPIAYSLGNFAGYRAFSTSGPTAESAVLQMRLRGDGTFVGARLRPVTLTSQGLPQPGGDAITTVRALSQEDFAGAAPTIAADGTIAPPAGRDGSGPAAKTAPGRLN